MIDLLFLDNGEKKTSTSRTGKFRIDYLYFINPIRLRSNFFSFIILFFFQITSEHFNDTLTTKTNVRSIRKT